MHKTITRIALCVFVALAVVSTPVISDSSDKRPTIYLTFDDGPSADSVTEDILELLAHYNAKATFFVTGQRTRRDASKIAAILYAGHAIGNHTHSHTNLTTISSQEVTRELRSAGTAVLDAGGPPLTCFRPPFGSTNERVDLIAADMGMSSVNWTTDTRDWDPLVATSTIYQTLEDSTNGSIVLMHDGPVRRSKTLLALSGWLAVSAHKYQFKPLPQCQPYGAGVQFAALDDQERDVAIVPETLETLLLKLRNYRFDLQRETAVYIPADSDVGDQVTARLVVK